METEHYYDGHLRGAIIGFGNVARYAHVPLWRNINQARIEAVVDILPEQEKAARDLLPEARYYCELDALLADHDLDFLDICTPPCFHADLVAAACRAGLHVLCEKPLVTNLRSLHQVLQAATTSSTVVFTVNNWKYAPLWIKALELIREGTIGAVHSISLSVLRPPSSGGGATEWRRCADVSGGGILLDHGWHHFYLTLAVMQQPPRLISATLEHGEVHGPRLEETARLTMKFAGAEAQLHLTWCASCRANFGTIVGDKGTLYCNDDHLILERAGRAPARFDFSENLSKGSYHLPWMLPVLEAFFREVQDVSLRGTNLREAYWCAHLIDAAYRSQREGGRFVSVDDDARESFHP